MTPFTEEDFPILARGYNVYRRTESSPICTCSHMDMANEIALRLNRERGKSVENDKNNEIPLQLQ